MVPAVVDLARVVHNTACIEDNKTTVRELAGDIWHVAFVIDVGSDEFLNGGYRGIFEARLEGGSWGAEAWAGDGIRGILLQNPR